MSDTVWIALIAAVAALFGTVISPIIISRNVNKAAAAARREEREHETANRLADYVRQDEVAARAEVAAKQAAEVARLLLQDNQKVSQVQTAIATQLGDIHTLVNNNLSQAIINERDARVDQLRALRELVTLQGNAVLPETVAAIQSLEAKVVELNSVLTDRARQVAIVEASKQDLMGPL